MLHTNPVPLPPLPLTVTTADSWVGVRFAGVGAGVGAELLLGVGAFVFCARAVPQMIAVTSSRCGFIKVVFCLLTSLVRYPGKLAGRVPKTKGRRQA